MIIQVILIDEAQKAWVEAQNASNPSHQAIVCDHGQGNDICASVLTASGYEAFAAYFSGATVTDIEITGPF